MQNSLETEEELLSLILRLKKIKILNKELKKESPVINDLIQIKLLN